MSVVWDVNAGKPVSAAIPTREAYRLADDLEDRLCSPFLVMPCSR